MLVYTSRARSTLRRQTTRRPLFFFFFNVTATTEIYTLSLHDALPISPLVPRCALLPAATPRVRAIRPRWILRRSRSEEHTSELQSRGHLVCRLLLEKKNKLKHASLVGQQDYKHTDEIGRISKHQSATD